jgi:2-oxoglutarate ferredoxin oxidoreductase subunit alpha
MTNEKKSNIVLMQGNEACTLGAIKAGATFFGGYPITPSTEIAEYIAREFPRLGRHFMQMEDEIASIGAMIGASMVGHKAFTATSGPGFSLMQELIGYAAVAEIPLVIIDVMRFGPSTGLPTMPQSGDIMQARWGTHGDHSIIALSPSSVTEAYYATIRAFNLAEQYRTPVILLLDEKIGHLREGFDISNDPEPEIINRAGKQGENYIPFENTESGVPPFVPLGQGERYHFTGLTHNEAGFYTSNADQVTAFMKRICGKIEDHVDEIAEIELTNIEDAEAVIIAYGAVARSAQEAIVSMRAAGKKIGLLRLKTIWPFPSAKVRKICLGKKLVVMPEMNMGQLAPQVKAALGDIPFVSMTQANGRLIKPETIERAVEENLAKLGVEI